LQHQIAARTLHPIENLDASVPGETGQCHPPALVDNDRADRSAEAASLRAFMARPPGSTDRADKVEAGIALRRQDDSHLALTEFTFGVRRFLAHAATMAANVPSRPEARLGCR